MPAMQWLYGPQYPYLRILWMDWTDHMVVQFIDAIDVPMSPLDSAFINISSAICLRNSQDW